MEKGILNGRKSYVRKLGVLNVYSLAETESWLNAMTAEGLRLKKFGSLWVTFERSEAVPALYSIVAVEERKYKRKPKATHEPGWNFVDQKNALAIYAWYGEGEPAWDHEVFLNELKWVEEIEKRYFGTGVTMPLVLLALNFVIWKNNIQTPTNLLTFIDRGQDMLPWLIFCGLGIIADALSNYGAARKWKKRLIESRREAAPIPQKPWLKRYRGQVIRSYLFNLLLLSVVALAIFNTGIFNKRALNQAEGLPIVRLMAVEKDSRMKPVYSPSDGKILGNDLEYRFSFLAPVQVKASEWVQIPEKSLSEGENKYEPILYNRYYWMTISSMSETMLQDLMAYYSAPEDVGNFVALQHKGFDQLFVSAHQDSVKLVGRKGHAVLFISYGGHASSAVLIEAAAKALESK